MGEHKKGIMRLHGVDQRSADSQKHGGGIRAESSPENGTTVFLTVRRQLPISTTAEKIA